MTNGHTSGFNLERGNSSILESTGQGLASDELRWSSSAISLSAGRHSASNKERTLIKWLFCLRNFSGMEVEMDCIHVMTKTHLRGHRPRGRQSLPRK